MSHTQSVLNISVNKIIENDTKLISYFFNKKLNENNLYHCILVQQYLKLLKRFNIQAEEALKAQFRTSDYILYDLMTNKLERVELKLSHDAYKKYKNKKIEKLTCSYSENDYDKVFHQLYEVLQLFEKNSQWKINQGVLQILENLSSQNPDLSCKVIINYLEQGDYLEIKPWTVLSNMLLSCEATRVFDIINTPEYPAKNRWFFSYYRHLPNNEIEQKHINALYELYKKSEYKYFINDIDYLLKYETIQKGVITNIIQIIIARVSATPELAHSLSLILNPNTEINRKLNSVFSSKFILLEDVYMAVDRVEQHADDNESTLSVILDNDHAFIDRYLKDKFSRKDYISHHDDSQDYSFIWLRDDYMNIMKRITSCVFEHDCKGYCYDYYKIFFNESVNPQSDNIILEKQDEYLLKEIETGFAKKDYIRFIFSVIAGFLPKRKLIFYGAFLDKNKGFNNFKNLPYEPIISSWSGSAVAMLREKIDFYEKIVQLCNSVEFLKHRQFIEQRIQEIRNQIQHETKRDFTET